MSTKFTTACHLVPLLQILMECGRCLGVKMLFYLITFHVIFGTYDGMQKFCDFLWFHKISTKFCRFHDKIPLWNIESRKFCFSVKIQYDFLTTDSSSSVVRTSKLHWSCVISANSVRHLLILCCKIPNTAESFYRKFSVILQIPWIPPCCR